MSAYILFCGFACDLPFSETLRGDQQARLKAMLAHVVLYLIFICPSSYALPVISHSLKALRGYRKSIFKANLAHVDLY